MAFDNTWGLSDTRSARRQAIKHSRQGLVLYLEVNRASENPIAIAFVDTL
jgi:hypothetical protein